VPHDYLNSRFEFQSTKAFEKSSYYSKPRGKKIPQATGRFLHPEQSLQDFSFLIWIAPFT
jgi:hypothetical protein